MRRTLVLCLLVIATIALLSHQPRIRAANSFAADVRSNYAANPYNAAQPNSPATFFAPADTKSLATWDAKSAAGYLDQRAAWWMSWPRAQRDHETFCISCHTAVPYAISRSSLRSALGEQSLPPVERRLLDNVTKRVRLWHEVEPFYNDKDRGPYKSVESRGTESVLNALVLASHDATTGHLSPDTLTAFSNMWAEQVVAAGTPASRPGPSGTASVAASAKAGYDAPSVSTAPTYADAPNQLGAWRWLRFKNEPWEADDSDFYGAALAAIAVGMAPENYRARAEIQPNLKLLHDYLNRQSSSEPLMNRVVLLWASTKLPGILDSAQQKVILNQILSKQEPDGGWSLPALAPNWQRHDNSPQDPQSDGYATGLIAFVLEQFALPLDSGRLKTAPLPDDHSVRLRSALAWLSTHQDPSSGAWPSVSLNNNAAHHISPDTVRFMNDAATAYAVLALNER
jgi:squalene-hopene/tetraprenyl-beta-curcumene cyclase